MERKVLPKSQHAKKAQQVQKPKASRPKTIGVKSRVKGVPVKQKATTKASGKNCPAAIPEPGYAMYSTDSEDMFSLNTEKTHTCAKVLNMLREKRRVDTADNRRPVTSGSSHGNRGETSAPNRTPRKDNSARPPIVIPCVTNDDVHSTPGHVTAMSILAGMNTPFNNRLSSSTPDPDRPQIIPERDTNSTHKVSNGTFGVAASSMETNVHPGTDGHFYSSHGYQTVTPPGGNGVYFAASQGFTVTEPMNQNEATGWEKRDSDIGAFQAYIPRDSTGFLPVNGQTPELVGVSKPQENNQSGSSGNKSKSSQHSSSNNTGNSSGTEYIYLPRPVGNMDVDDRNVPPGFQFQNGLYQIKTLGPITTGASGEERQIHGAQLIPVSPTFPASTGRTNSGSDATSNINPIWEIPERDNNGPAKSPRIVQDYIEIAADTLSTIDGSVSVSHTMETLTPRSNITDTNTGVPEVGRSKVQSSKSKATSDMKNRKNVKIDSKKISSNESSGTNKTVSFNTQSSQFSVSNSAQSQTTQSAGSLYHLIQTDKGRELVPVSLVHHPSFVHIPSAIVGQGHQNSSSAMTSEGQSQPIADQGSEIMPVAGQPNPWSRVRLDAGMKRVHYILSEMRECGKINKDVEIGRLVKEVEKSLESIPQLSSTFSLQAEIDLALQPLRNENAQLRRKLRLANQKNVRDQEQEKGTASVDFDVIHLQASNTALQKQVKEEMEDKVKLAAELATQLNLIQRMKIERNKLLAALSEKETDELKVKQENLVDSQKFRKEVESMNRQIEAIRIQQQASDQENHILQISLKQRDTEISRLQDMVQDMKISVNELIQELDQTGDRSMASNQSFGLQKLLRVLGGAPQQAGPPRSILSPPRNTHRYSPSGTPVKTLRFDPREMDSHVEYQPAKLTERALASHNRSLERKQDVNRGSNSEEELQLHDGDRATQRQRRRSSSPHGQRESKQGYRRRALSSSPRRVDRLSLIGSEIREVDTGSILVDNLSRPVSGNIGNFPETVGKINNDHQEAVRGNENRVGYHNNAYGYQRVPSWGQANPDNRSDAEQSRYSVTDYFKKYHTPISNTENQESHPYSSHHRTHSQPARLMLGHAQQNSHNDGPRNPNRPLLPSSDPMPSNLQHGTIIQPFIAPPRSQGVSRPKQRSPQDRLYQGTTLDTSLSAIDDDNISSVSGSGKTFSSSTVTDNTFRKGIATLDANILKLQLALQRTKSMLS